MGHLIYGKWDSRKSKYLIILYWQKRRNSVFCIWTQSNTEIHQRGVHMNQYRISDTVYMTAGIKRYLLKHSEEIQNALRRFRKNDYDSEDGKPDNDLLVEFGAYELPFGTIWIINYDLFSGQDFITVLLPKEYY